MKSYAVFVQMKPLLYYFHVVLNCGWLQNSRWLTLFLTCTLRTFWPKHSKEEKRSVEDCATPVEWKNKIHKWLMAMKNCKWNEMPLRELEIIIIKQLILFQVQAKWRKVLIEDFKMSFYGICYSCVTLIIFRFFSFFFLSSVLLETKINTCVTNSRLKQNTVSPLGTWWEV